MPATPKISRAKVALLAAGALAVLALGLAIALHRAGDGEKSTFAGCPLRGPGAELQSCYARGLLSLMEERRSPRAALAAVERIADEDGGYLGANCHIIMHTVGRKYGAAHSVTLANMKDFLPKNNDAGCSAGFAHGLITHLAPDIDIAHPRRSAAVCHQAPNRYQQYSCVHGFGHAVMRLYGDDLRPALRLCRRMGRRVAPDCAQGAYHDYWFSVVGTDDAPKQRSAARTPRALCRRQPREFVRPCWYRAFIDTRPAGYQTKTATDVLKPCADLVGIQRRGCITATSVIGSPNPLKQFRVCASLPRRDVLSCVFGVKSQNLLGTRETNMRRLVSRCDWLGTDSRLPCYRWFGRTLSVITNGRFMRTGCTRLKAADARSACLEGAERMDEVLVTFS
jgi:hypothetical protein